MDKSEKQLIELYLKVDVIIDKLLKTLKETNIVHYNLIVSDLNNLPDFVKQSDKQFLNRLNFLKCKNESKKIENPISFFSSGDLRYLDSEEINIDDSDFLY